jgi:protein associated with RNAse G/E
MGGKKTRIDLEQLRLEIKELNSHKMLYKVLKEELTKIDHWKQQKRGKPNPRFIKRNYG